MREPQLRGWAGNRCTAVVRDGHSWSFGFGTAGGITAMCPWRLVNQDRIVLTSEDEGQRFGLPAPIDAAKEAQGLLSSLLVERVSLDEKTADLIIEFAGPMQLQFWNNSSGYEGWQANVTTSGGHSVVIGLGGGGTSGYDLPTEQT